MEPTSLQGVEASSVPSGSGLQGVTTHIFDGAVGAVACSMLMLACLQADRPYAIEKGQAPCPVGGKSLHACSPTLRSAPLAHFQRVFIVVSCFIATVLRPSHIKAFWIASIAAPDPVWTDILIE